MVKRVSFWDDGCPVARALDVIGDWWSLLIIRDAFDGVTRFTQFQSGLGIGKGVLAGRLRDLMTRGILETSPASDGSAYHEYVLTERGRGLFLVIVALRQWAESHLYADDEPRSALAEKRTGRPVGKLGLRSMSGRRLDWQDTRVEKVNGDG